MGPGIYDDELWPCDCSNVEDYVPYQRLKINEPKVGDYLIGDGNILEITNVTPAGTDDWHVTFDIYEITIEDDLFTFTDGTTMLISELLDPHEDDLHDTYTYETADGLFDEKS